MNREVLDDWCERGILGLVLLILAFGPLAAGGVHVPTFLTLQFLTVGVALLWGIRLWISPSPKWLWPPVLWAVIAFSLYVTARYFTADIEFVARNELLRVLVYAVLFLAIVNNLHRQEYVQVISFTLVFLAMAISIYAIYQFITGSDWVWHMQKYYARRASGTFFSPNNLAGFLEMVAPLGLAYAIVGRARHVTRILLGYASLVILVGIGVSVSRGSWIATGCALIFFFALLLTQARFRLPALVILGLLVLGGAILFPKSDFVRFRVQRIIASENRDDSARLSLWRPAVLLWHENIWFGTGPGHFNDRFRKYRPEVVQAQPDRVHNDYLNTLADLGIIGLTLVAVALALVVYGVVKTWRFVRTSDNGLGARVGSNKLAFVLGASSSLVAIALHSIVDFNMHVPSNAILAITLMALLSSHLRFATDRFWSSARWPSRAAFSAVLVVIVAYLAQEGVRASTEYRWLARARLAPEASEEQIGALKKAFAVEPFNPTTAADLGEAYRKLSQLGGHDHRDLANQSADWYRKATVLNPYDPRGFLGLGWCLDWLGKFDESDPYFSQAAELDPNNYFVMLQVGLHYQEMRNYAASRPWLERSLCLEGNDNPTARIHLDLANIRLLEAATNQLWTMPAK
jgi:O-antigen ligase